MENRVDLPGLRKEKARISWGSRKNFERARVQPALGTGTHMPARVLR